jgi:hypothetical protein
MLDFLVANWPYLFLFGGISAIIAFFFQLKNMRSIITLEGKGLFARFGFVIVFMMIAGISGLMGVIGVIASLIDRAK